MINYKGKKYKRQVELLGDVERVIWFEVIDMTTQTEIYDDKLSIELEKFYEKMLLIQLFPTKSII